MAFILPFLIILEAILWMLDVNPPGDTVWSQWLWATMGVYLLLGDGFIGAVRSRTQRQQGR